ncbi:MAG: hypothetical protein J3K34DRAFT_88644 [Monoraphidium minutum]|nr:MAG: hypothetical protein J3K34DRAFT_88644 [Monoraphidium minutum]
MRQRGARDQPGTRLPCTRGETDKGQGCASALPWSSKAAVCPVSGEAVQGAARGVGRCCKQKSPGCTRNSNQRMMCTENDSDGFGQAMDSAKRGLGGWEGGGGRRRGRQLPAPTRSSSPCMRPSPCALSATLPADRAARVTPQKGGRGKGPVHGAPAAGPARARGVYECARPLLALAGAAGHCSPGALAGCKECAMRSVCRCARAHPADKEQRVAAARTSAAALGAAAIVAAAAAASAPAAAAAAAAERGRRLHAHAAAAAAARPLGHDEGRDQGCQGYKGRGQAAAAAGGAVHLKGCFQVGGGRGSAGDRTHRAAAGAIEPARGRGLAAHTEGRHPRGGRGGGRQGERSYQARAARAQAEREARRRRTAGAVAAAPRGSPRSVRREGRGDPCGIN